jgi:hypothetical protein
MASLRAESGDDESSPETTPAAVPDEPAAVPVEEAVGVTADETLSTEHDPEGPATSEVDTDEPPPAPPIEVAVVRTEVAPLPSVASASSEDDVEKE